jgi:RNA polymerase sigma-70 factor (ECF subfamily)
MSLYEAHGAGLLRYAMSICRSADAARDGLQEAFVRYLMARQGGASIANAKAWLFRVLHNYLVDAGAQPSGEVQLEAIEHQADPKDWQAHMAGQHLRAQLSLLLSPKENECLMLRLEGLTYEEIADTLNLQPGTVGALLYRVTRKARTMLGQAGSRHE